MLEHARVVTQLIWEARESRGDLAALWLDLTNAYVSIPNKLVKTALAWHHVPEMIRNLMLDYYNNFRLRVSSGSLTSIVQSRCYSPLWPRTCTRKSIYG